jgi:hypothetical protein
MITLLGTIIFGTVVAIGLADRNRGLSLLEKDGPAHDGIEPAPGGPKRSRRDHQS